MNLSSQQEQTSDSFGFKWAMKETYNSDSMNTEWRRWLLEKYFDGSADGPKSMLAAFGRPIRILDAGCGASISSLLLFGDLLNEHAYVGVDISESVDVARENLVAAGIKGTVVKGDITNLSPDLGNFDLIFSEGVIHHTDSVRDTIISLATRLNPGGKIVFYVYQTKGPVREFTDDYIRDKLSSLDNEEAWNELLPLTELGKILGELDVSINIPNDISVLGISKGNYDLQRLFYYSICKAYYRDDYSIEEMNHINFDWFRPSNCHRHSEDEIREYSSEAGIKIERLKSEPSGISVIATKNE